MIYGALRCRCQHNHLDLLIMNQFAYDYDPGRICNDCISCIYLFIGSYAAQRPRMCGFLLAAV